MIHKLIFDTTDADTRAASHTVGAILYDAANDRLGVINASNELTVTDGSANTTLTSIESEIQSLSHAEDAAHVSGDAGTMSLAVRNDTEGSLAGTDGDYAPLQVDATGRLRVVADVDVTNLSEKAEDSAHVSADIGDYVLAVRADARPTNANTSADGDYASFFVNTNGELYTKATDTDALLTTIDVDTGAIAVSVASIDSDTTTIATNTGTTATNTGTIAGDTTSMDATLTALSKAEDAAHVSGDQGVMGLAVRNDTLAALAGTDGDYAPLQVNADGALYTEISNTITTSDSALANTAIATAANTIAVASTAEDLVASPLADRKYLFVYNNDNQDAYIGPSGVSVANGFPLPPGSLIEARVGAAIDIEFISAKVGLEVRTMELS